MPRTRAQKASALVEEVPEVASDDDEQTTTCVICLDEITPEQKQHGGEMKLKCCTHVFHAICFNNHMCSGNSHCPICRADVYISMEEIEEEATPFRDDYIPYSQAVKLGKKDKKNKSTQKSFQGIRKWKQEKKNEQASFKAIETRLAPEEKLINEKVKLFEEKLNAEFDFKYAKDTLARKEHRKNIAKARSAIRNIEVRIARKYGWGSLR